MVAGGFQAPLLIPTDGRTRESFFPLTPCPDEQQWRACHGFIKYSLTATTHTQRHDTKEAQYNFQCADIELYRKKTTFTSFPTFSKIEQSAPVPLKPQ